MHIGLGLAHYSLILESNERKTKPSKTQELDINQWQVKVYKKFFLTIIIIDVLCWWGGERTTFIELGRNILRKIYSSLQDHGELQKNNRNISSRSTIKLSTLSRKDNRQTGAYTT